MLRLSTSYLRPLTLVLAGVLILFGGAACDSAGGPGDTGGDSPGDGGPGGDDPTSSKTLEVNFQATAGSNASTAALLRKSAHDSVVVEGANGQLKITDIRFIVEEIELGREDDSLNADGDSLDFNTSPSFLDLPLDTTEVASADSLNAPAGTYSEFEFEVDDLEPDTDDTDQEREQIQELLGQIREEFSDFPADASMVAVGTFTPSDADSSNGGPSDFTTYIEAEIEVERDFPEQNPLEVTSDGFSRSLTVKLDPSGWFTTSDGDVRNLAQRQSTDDLLEIEEEFENGVADIEVEEGDDDDDDDDSSDDDSSDDDSGDDDSGDDDA